MITDFSSLTLEQLQALKSQVGPSALSRIEEAIAAKGQPPKYRPPTSWTSEPGVSEKEVQRRINQRLRELGAAVYWMSQARASGQTRGVPDLLVFDPVRGLFFVEVKAEGGVHSEDQVRFQARCEAAGVPYVIGGMAEIEEFLRGGGSVDP